MSLSVEKNYDLLHDDFPVMPSPHADSSQIVSPQDASEHLLSSSASSNFVCVERDEIAAYLDGELDADAEARFERHVKDCASCARELASQRQLLCVLSATVEAKEKELTLPRDFAAAITARAQSDMSGLRSLPSERRRALALCISATLLVLGTLSALAAGGFLSPLMTAARAVWGLLSVVGRALAQFCEGSFVVLRVIGSHMLSASNMRGAAAWIAFGAALAALAFLIEKYRQTPRARE